MPTKNSLQFLKDLAKNNKECFYYILTEFLNAFPTSNFDERVTEAKND